MVLGEFLQVVLNVDGVVCCADAPAFDKEEEEEYSEVVAVVATEVSAVGVAGIDVSESANRVSVSITVSVVVGVTVGAESIAESATDEAEVSVVVSVVAVVSTVVVVSVPESEQVVAEFVPASALVVVAQELLPTLARRVNVKSRESPQSLDNLRVWVTTTTVPEGDKDKGDGGG